MAVDEVLLEWAAETGGACWRMYRWEEATLSLGYFQSYDERWQHAPSRKCPVVRRASGGGAIVHDAELTYSCVWPQGHRLAEGRLRLYEEVHHSLIDLLADYGLQASLCGGSAEANSARPPLLCFQRRSPGDIVVGSTKIVGSAQRRSRGAVLQHGSILLTRSPAAPELEGVAELGGMSLTPEEFLKVWLPVLATRLGLTWQPQPLSDAERARATVLVETKYGSDSWTVHRGR
jgi:lipoate-protein ligase A